MKSETAQTNLGGYDAGTLGIICSGTPCEHQSNYAPLRKHQPIEAIAKMKSPQHHTSPNPNVRKSCIRFDVR